MKTLLLLTLSTIWLLTGCSVNKEPVFQKVKAIQLLEKKANAVVFLLLLEFHNPNVLGGTFESDELSFLVNDVAFSQLKSPAFEVPAQEKFTMPIQISLDKQTFQGKQLELISLLLNMLAKQQVALRIQGELKYKVLGYTSTYPLDYQEVVSF